jgi:hypothetical protein
MKDRATMYALDEVLNQIQHTFDANNLPALKRFLAQYNGCMKWVLSSDYNWDQASRPQDVIVFTLYPDPTVVGNQENLASLFPNDFKKSSNLLPETKDWFRSGNAFHVCFVLEKQGSLFHSGGANRLQVARESIQATVDFLVKSSAPSHIIGVYRKLLQESRSNKFPVSLYGDLIFTTLCYAFIAGAIAREKRLEQILWISDRDRLTTWHNGVLYDIALVQAVRFASKYGRRFDAKNLPFLVLTSDRSAEKFDYVIRSADFLAGSLSAWSVTGSRTIEGATKYRDMLRDAIADNDYVALLHVRLGKVSMNVASFTLQLTGNVG